MDNSIRKVAIKIEGVKKKYKLGQIGGGSLQKDLQSWWARFRGKEDPNSRLGEGERIKGQTFMALNGIDLTVYKGEALGIIGGNGAGKSTLLKLLSRVTAPTEGTIDLYGRVTSMLEVGTGFSGEMTGRENVYLNGAILGMTKAEIDSKMEQIIDFSEVRDFIDTPVKRYSSGMYVKLAFSVAAHLDSEIMIMDEVLAVGDMAFQKKCLDKMRDAARKEGRTVLYVSHNMNTIRNLCDRCIVMHKGKIVYDGDTEKAISLYMNQGNSGSGVCYDYTDIKRPGVASMRLELRNLRMVGRLNNTVSKGDTLELLIGCRCNSGGNKTGFRFEIRSDNGDMVGTVFSDKSLVFADGEECEIRVKLPTDNIAPGRYMAVALAYEYNSAGQQVYVDRVEPAMFFNVVNEKEGAMAWLPQYWGHVHFDDMTVEKTD
ncbi:MAG: ABC transporter ATP-binding protein [Clostridia bacterium]|nr:ABC transporter ATP-binding protein [Clostridia bacterium]